MSESDGGPGRREVAYRLFAAEYDDADLSYSESDEERAPNYVVTPSGARVNRLFAVGVLTEIENVSDDYLRARVVDPTGPFVVYAGQYQPEAMRFLEAANPPTFVAVTGKARTFQPDDSDRVYTSIRPESINEVDADTRDRWVIQAAEATLSRVARAAEARSSGLTGDDLEASLVAADVEEGLANGIPIALDRYETSGEYLAALRDVALDSLRVVAGERDEVEASLPAPDAGGDDPLADLAERTLETVSAESTADTRAPEGDTDTTEAPTDEPGATTEQVADESETAAGTEATAESTTESASDSEESAETPVATAGDAGTTTEEPATANAGADDGTVDESAVSTAGDDTAGTPDGTESATDESAADTTESSGDIGDFEGEFELDEDEREEIESEYGTEFKSGTEVEEPGEADIETPDPDEAAAGADAAEETGATGEDDEATDRATEAAGAEDATVVGSEPAEEVTDEPAEETEPDPADEAEPESADEAEPETVEDEETAADIALDDAVMDAMTDLDDGDGADRDAVVAEVVEATGADPGDVEDAIQDALMDGRCYEPADGTLKPI